LQRADVLHRRAPRPHQELAGKVEDQAQACAGGHLRDRLRAIIVNREADVTTSRDVELRIHPDCASDVRFKNRYTDLWEPWQPLSQSDFGQFAWTPAGKVKSSVG